MSAILLAAIALAAPPPASSPSLATPASTSTSTTTTTDTAPRTMLQWRDEVQSALRQQAKAKEADQPAAVAQLLKLYQELGQTQQHLSSTEQNRLRMKVRTRLVRLRQQIPTDIQLIALRIDSLKQQAKEQQKPELLDKVRTDQATLAQWKGVLAQMGGGAAPGGAAASTDDGQRLADLIEAVIEPDFWNVNGGPGAVVYYPGLKALVVSATEEIHGQTGGVLDQLRRAGN